MKYLIKFLKVFMLFILVSSTFHTIKAQDKKADLEMKKILEAATEAVAEAAAEVTINDLKKTEKNKFIEYQLLLAFLADDQNDLLNNLKSLQTDIINGKSLLKRFDLADSYLEDEIITRTVDIEIDTDFERLLNLFDKIAKSQKIMSIYRMKIRQLEKQIANRTLNAKFSVAFYYKGKNSNSIEKTRPSFSTILEEQKYLERQINKHDASINAIKNYRALQGGPSSVLLALRERISSTPGIFLESIEQEENIIVIKGHATDEAVVTRFGGSLEFSGGLFSNLKFQTQRKDIPNATISTNNPNAQIPQIVVFSIYCEYNPIKVN